MPITLASFTAESNPFGPGVLLEWATVTEVNNYGFFVERREESEANFTTVPNSFSPGHGTTIEPQYYSIVDNAVSPGQWWYRLKQIDLDGSVHYGPPVSVNVVTGVNKHDIPTTFALHQNYPNPFNPASHIDFDLPQSSFVTLKIYDVLGREISTLVEGPRSAGRYVAEWKAGGLAGGIYFYRLNAGSFSETRKLILAK